MTTSRIAFTATSSRHATSRAAVLDYIRRCESTGATSDEIESALAMLHQSVGPRLVELHSPRHGAPRIRDSGKRRITRAGAANLAAGRRGTTAIVWVAIDPQPPAMLDPWGLDDVDPVWG